MVELRGPASTDADALVDYLRTRLARYEIPTDIAIVDTIPRTPSGKADLAQSSATSVNPPPIATMPGDSPTVAEILRHQARLRGDHPLLVCDGDRISYAEADRRSRRACPRADRPRCRQGHSCRAALPERHRVRRRHAGGGANRSGGRPVLHLRHRSRAARAADRQRRRNPAWPPRRFAPTITCSDWPRSFRTRDFDSDDRLFDSRRTAIAPYRDQLPSGCRAAHPRHRTGLPAGRHRRRRRS